MSTLSPNSGEATQKGRRRRRSSSPPPVVTAAAESSPRNTSASSFRNVSACNRCRLRKNRCDQRLPACISCEKAGVRCVGYDPITKREIPRSYVHYLESRLHYLQALLEENGIPFDPAETLQFPLLLSNNDLATSSTPIGGVSQDRGSQDIKSPITPTPTMSEGSPKNSRTVSLRQKSTEEGGESDASNETGLNKLVDNIALVSVQGASDPRYLGSVSGISFARVVFAAVKSINSGTSGPGSKRSGSVSGNANESDRGNVSGEKIGGDNGMRDSFFGLATSRKKVRPAKWPSRQLANRLVGLYFEHANPQLPVLHRVEFEEMVEKVYAELGEREWQGSTYRKKTINHGGDTDVRKRTVGARERYMMNIVFAIGAGIFLENDSASSTSGASDDDRRTRRSRGGAPKKNFTNASNDPLSPPLSKRLKRDSVDVKQEPSEKLDEDYEMVDVEQEDEFEVEERQYSPEAYHAAALPHLEAFLSESKGGTEELQAILLLAGYALLRPVAPGLWYIVGVAMRMAVDLGLHFEDNGTGNIEGKEEDEKTNGKRDWHREMRRRLWWSVYSLDRLVSTCVGRPIGIQDEVISTRFPSSLPDEYITREGFLAQEVAVSTTYKTITHHYIRLRLLQSEILQVLQQQQSTSPGQSQKYPSYHPYNLKSPYLHNFDSLREWHCDVDKRLRDWIDCAPKSKEETGVDFALEFLELNYWQTVLMLYKPCLKIPVFLKGEAGGGKGTVDAGAKGVGIGSLRGNGKRGSMDGAVLWGGGQEEEERIHLVVADAGSRVLKLYRSLHRVHQVNYTFLATHHLFMSGISFLYAVWHSPLVRSQLSIDDIDFTIMAATTVLGGLVVKCPPAQACKEAFERMSQATMKLCHSTRGGGMNRTRPVPRFWSSPYGNKVEGRIEQRMGGQGKYDRKPQSEDVSQMGYVNEPRREGNSQNTNQSGRQQLFLQLEGQKQQQRLQRHHSDQDTRQPSYNQAQNWQRSTIAQQENQLRRRDPMFDMNLDGLLKGCIQMNQSNVRSQVVSQRQGAHQSPPQPIQSPNYPDANTQGRSQEYSSPTRSYYSSTEEKNFHVQHNYQSPQTQDSASDTTLSNSPELYTKRIGKSAITSRENVDLTPEETYIDPDLQFQNFSTGLSPEMANTPSPAISTTSIFDSGSGAVGSGFPIPGFDLFHIDNFDVGRLGGEFGDNYSAWGQADYLGGFFANFAQADGD